MATRLNIVSQPGSSIRQFLEAWQSYIEDNEAIPLTSTDKTNAQDPSVQVIKNNRDEIFKLRERVTAELGWHAVVIPGRLSGDNEEIKERVEFCQEQFGPCAMARQGKDFTFDDRCGWVAFQSTRETQLTFCFRDVNEATLFRLARG